MKSHAILLILIFSILCGSAYAETRGEIVLTDGSVLYGKIRSVSGDIYTIESSTMGVVKVHQSKIREIRFGTLGATRETDAKMPKTDMNSEIQAIQKSLLANQEILNIILTLQDDPEFRKILSDPDVMNSVLAGDVQSLMANPKFVKLLNHPKLKAIQRKMEK